MREITYPIHINLVPIARFDDRSVLRCEMARKNMFINDATGKRGRFDGHYAASAPYFSGAASAPAGQSYSGGSSTRPDNPPCNTLFIGGLGEGVRHSGLRMRCTTLQACAHARALCALPCRCCR